jgi:hypothetical protein
MSAQDEEQTSSQDSGEEQQTSSDATELSEEGKEKVEDMTKAYDDSRQTAVMPGTDRTITGTAVNEWLDDEGNPKFGKEKQQEREAQQDDESQDAEDA